MTDQDLYFLAALVYFAVLMTVVIIFILKNKGDNVSTNVLDGMDGEDTVGEINNRGERRSPEQIKNQRRIQREIRDFVRNALQTMPPDFSTLEVKKLYGNRYRVNLVTTDKRGNQRRPLSYVIHYQKDAISADEQTPIINHQQETENADAVA